MGRRARQMNKKRPVNLNLLTIKQPIPAIVSIGHRVSGVLLFLLFPVLLILFHLSLSSSQNFNLLHEYLTTRSAKIILWLALFPLVFHLIAGIRHLLIDVHLGEDLRTGRLTAKLTFIFSFL